MIFQTRRAYHWAWRPVGGHSDVVRELIHQFGIEGCGGESGGVRALHMAMMNLDAKNTDVLAILADAGVVDEDGVLLGVAAKRGNEVAVKFLLQRQQRQQQPEKAWEERVPPTSTSPAASEGSWLMPLVDATKICVCGNRPSPRVVRLLVDAAATVTRHRPFKREGRSGRRNAPGFGEPASSARKKPGGARPTMRRCSGWRPSAAC